MPRRIAMRILLSGCLIALKSAQRLSRLAVDVDLDVWSLDAASVVSSA